LFAIKKFAAQFFIKRGHGAQWQLKGIKMKKSVLAVLFASTLATTAYAGQVYIGDEAVYTPAFWVGGYFPAQGINGTAIGSQASALGDGSVAIGSGSVATEANTMAVGGRKIVGVNDGLATTDAVNVGQLKDGLADVYNQAVSYTDGQVDILNQTIVEGDANTLNQANTYTDSKVSTITNVSKNYTDARVSGAVSNLMQQVNEGDTRTLNQANNYTDSKFNELNDGVKRVGALAMLQFAQDHNPCHRSSLALSIGGYRGKHAVGAQYAYKVTHRMRLQGTAAYDGKHVGYSVSGNYSWE
jgi:autotransporter adhesin